MKDERYWGTDPYPGCEDPDYMTCVNCGDPVRGPTLRSQCQSCREADARLARDPSTPHGNDQRGRPDDDPDHEIQQFQFAVIVATSRSMALTKGKGALARYAEVSKRVDQVIPVDDFIADFPDVYAEQWAGELPGVTPLNRTTGHRIVTFAREAAADSDATDQDQDPPQEQEQDEHPLQDTNLELELDLMLDGDSEQGGVKLDLEPDLELSPDPSLEPTPDNAQGVPYFVGADGQKIDCSSELVKDAIDRAPPLDQLADVRNGEPRLWLVAGWVLRSVDQSASTTHR